MSLPLPTLAAARIFESPFSPFEKREFENCDELFQSREVLERHGINVNGVFENRQFSEKNLEEGNESRVSEVFNNVTIRRNKWKEWSRLLVHPRGVEGTHDFLGNSANSDLIRQAKGEPGQAPVPTPTLETKLKETEKSKFDWGIMAPLLMNLQQKTNDDSKKCSSSNCPKEGKIFLCFECGFISGTKITGNYHMRKSHLDLSTTLNLFCHDCSVEVAVKVLLITTIIILQTFLIKHPSPGQIREPVFLLNDF